LPSAAAISDGYAGYRLRAIVLKLDVVKCPGVDPMEARERTQEPAGASQTGQAQARSIVPIAPRQS
ncbi:MAG: hypothetical protein ACO4AJ_09555, partial [Prochlorothrix sp.]